MFYTLKILVFITFLSLNKSFANFLTVDSSVVTNQEVIKKLKLTTKKYSLIYFIEPTCPISKTYMPIIADIEKKNNKWQVQIFYIFPNKFSQRNECRAFINENGLKSKWIYDSNHLITNALKATVTPEVFIIDQGNRVIYHGAIDNLYYGLGKKRTSSTENYLKNILTNLENKTNHIPISYHQAYGCDIE